MSDPERYQSSQPAFRSFADRRPVHNPDTPSSSHGSGRKQPTYPPQSLAELFSRRAPSGRRHAASSPLPSSSRYARTTTSRAGIPPPAHRQVPASAAPEDRDRTERPPASEPVST